MIDAGQGHYFQAIEHPCKGEQGVLLGYMWWHQAPDGRPCCGVVRTCRGHVADDEAEFWDDEGVVTLRPSLLCKRCDLHGFLVKGRWKDAGSPQGVQIVSLYEKRKTQGALGRRVVS